jgi:hypothetical protein
MDNTDGPKMKNPDVNFYSLSATKDVLAIDSRSSFTANDTVSLGIDGVSEGQYTINVKYNDLPNTNAFLIDKYMNSRTKLSQGVRYNFTTTSNPETFGVNRFKIEFSQLITVLENIIESAPITLYPNPSDGNVYLTNLGSQESIIAYRLFDISGRELLNMQVRPLKGEDAEVNLNEFNAGTYFLEINKGQGKQIIKVIKN